MYSKGANRQFVHETVYFCSNPSYIVQAQDQQITTNDVLRFSNGRAASIPGAT